MSSADTPSRHGPKRRSRPPRPPITVQALREEVPARRPHIVDAALTLWVGALGTVAAAVLVTAATLDTVRSSLIRAGVRARPGTAESEIARTVDLTFAVSAAVAASVAVVAALGAVGLLRRRPTGRAALAVAALLLTVGAALFFVLTSDADERVVQILPVIASVPAVIGSVMLYLPSVGRWLDGTGRLLAR